MDGAWLLDQSPEVLGRLNPGLTELKAVALSLQQQSPSIKPFCNGISIFTFSKSVHTVCHGGCIPICISSTAFNTYLFFF